MSRDIKEFNQTLSEEQKQKILDGIKNTPIQIQGVPTPEQKQEILDGIKNTPIKIQGVPTPDVIGLMTNITTFRSYISKLLRHDNKDTIECTKKNS